MRSRFSLWAVLSALMLFAAACGAQPTPAFVVSSTAVPGYGGAQTPAAIPATGGTATQAPPPAASASPAAVMPPAASARPGTQPPPATGTSLVDITINLQYGSILADGSGRTLYLYTRDTPGTPTCYDQCAATWPPFLASSGSPGVGSGLDPTKVGTAPRTDGTTQVTYNGWPLYYNSTDSKPGDAHGQGVDGAWYTVSPNGEPVK